jgi:SAM-dependent methyltransferase
MKANPLYASDLAYVHHVGFGDFARKAAPGLLRLLRRAGIHRGTLIDLACGSGLWAKAAHRAGFAVIGVDQSRAMIQLAKQVAPGAHFHQASLHEFALPPCDAVTIIGEGLNYRSPRLRVRSLDNFFARVARALRSGGLLIFDVVLFEGETVQRRNWRGGRDWLVLTDVSEQRSHRRLTRGITVFRKVGSRWRRTDEVHRLQLFSRAEILRSLRRAGFSCRAVRRYGAFPLMPRRMAFIARRKKAAEGRRSP